MRLFAIKDIGKNKTPKPGISILTENLPLYRFIDKRMTVSYPD